MTTNRMGLEQTLSDEQVKELGETLCSWQDGYDPIDDKEQYQLFANTMTALNELLARRDASRKPVADVVAWNKPGEERKCDIRWRRFDVAPGPLFAAPPLQVAPTGWKLVPIEPTENMVVEGFESEPDSFFSNSDEWEAYKAMSGCQQAAHKAKLCWAAMIAAAPSIKNEP
ncbi:hypothetical protein [Buttiauxella gaviniae]|uniref:hypothetical protein n=1 Tax=Buttiauxella gaviniae TaxID=82990 RepID=UPI0039B01B6A